MGNDVSTDEILPAGAKVLPYRSNIQKIEDFAFERIDSTYVERARAIRATTGHAVWWGPICRQAWNMHVTSVLWWDGMELFRHVLS